MHYFPRPYPDEIIGSLVVRACRHSGMPFRQLVRYLSGIYMRSYSSFLLTSFLPRIAYETGLPVDQLLDRNTIFPFASAFMSEADYVRLRDLLLNPNSDNKRGVAPLTHSVTKGVAYRRFCSKCIEADLNKCGESYWHRQHQLPGVIVCKAHKTRLCESVVPVHRGMRQTTYILPNEAYGTPLNTAIEDTIAYDIANRTSAVLRIRPKEERWSDIYRTLAKKKGYVLPTGSVAGTQISNDLLTYFTPEFISMMGCRYATSRYNAWPALMIRTSVHEPFSPIKHILLQAFLSNESIHCKGIVYRKPGKKAAQPY